MSKDKKEKTLQERFPLVNISAVAKKAGLSYNSVFLIFKGTTKRTTAEQRKKIALAMGVDEAQLFT